MQPRLLPLAVIVLLTACRTPKPATIAEWSSCVCERTTVRFEGLGAELVGGDSPLLYLHARWGDVPTAGKYSGDYAAGQIYLELPNDLAAGRVVSFSRRGPRAYYVEGSYELYYMSEGMLGTVRVLAADGPTMLLDLDLLTNDPSIDLSRRGPIELRGRIMARRTTRVADCP